MILQAKSLSKSFTSPCNLSLFHELELTVNQGESCAIMGRSGEGKTTLLHILGGLDYPTQGTVEIRGETLTSHNASKIRNESIGFIFQSFYLLEDYTVFENILMPARIGRRPVHAKSPSYQRAESLLHQLGLFERKDHFAKQLSGGEKQRVCLARALCNDPGLILADEPSGNLDKKNAENVHSLLLSLTRQQGKSLIVVTHDPELAGLCDRTYKLRDGRLHLEQSSRN